jgi:hypothetical protein
VVLLARPELTNPEDLLAWYGGCASMKLRPVILLIPILLLVPRLPNNLNAQTTTSGALAGVVTDPSSAVGPDADVEIGDNDKGAI